MGAMTKVPYIRAFMVSILLVAPFALYCEGYANGDSFSPDVMPYNKHVSRFVTSYIKNNWRELYIIKKRSRAPFAIVDSIFSLYHVPAQLKYLAVVESELKSGAVSRVGAVGPWQLMPATARILGLKVTRTRDERTQYCKSTKAAARYLKDLHAEFGDWLLVLAAYNGGPGPVYHAIHMSRSRDFWSLQNYLPAESRDHVKKFLAALYYFEGQTSISAR
jgi:membrane-bound lytic murein transglycosylase D